MNSIVTTGPDALDRILTGVDGVYRYPARQFVRFLKAEGLRIDDPAAWEKYRKDLGTLAASTQNTYIAAAKACIRYALAAHAAASDITAEQYRFYEDRVREILKSKKRPDPVDYVPSKVMTADEIGRLIEAAMTEGWGVSGRRRKDGSMAETRKHARPEIALMIEFLWQTAMRVSEMTGIRLKDMRASGTYYRIRIMGKGGRERWAKPSRELVDRIKAFFGGSTFLFEHHGIPYGRTHVSMSIHRVGMAVLDREISAHAIRHSALTHYHRQTKSLEGTRQLAGHRSSSITSAYYVHDPIDPVETLGIMTLPGHQNYSHVTPTTTAP